MEKGKIWKFGDNVDTDQIISTQYLLFPTIDEMKGYTFESLTPGFAGRVVPGDILIAGHNFGCGSSREQAPLVLKALGIRAVVARSFARIFFRNSINTGLPLIISDELHGKAKEGDYLALSFKEGKMLYNEEPLTFPPYPEHIRKIMRAGGLIEYINEGV